MHLWGANLLALMRKLVAKKLPEDTLLNINIPPMDPARFQGVKITTLGRRLYQDPVRIEEEGEEKFTFRIGGQGPDWKGENSCDFRAIEDGHISITPIHLDLTNYAAIEELRSWSL